MHTHTCTRTHTVTHTQDVVCIALTLLKQKQQHVTCSTRIHCYVVMYPDHCIQPAFNLLTALEHTHSSLHVLSIHSSRSDSRI